MAWWAPDQRKRKEWSAGQGEPPAKASPGHWQFVPAPVTVPLSEVAECTRCSAPCSHTYTFSKVRLQDEKYRYYAACAEGCLPCVSVYTSTKPLDFLQSVSNSKTYTAMGFAIYVLLEQGGNVGHERVIEELKKLMVEPLYYEWGGNAWKER
jgi:hypothetical protein